MTLLKNGSSVSVARAQAARRPSIQPFVCSTFKDFSSERDFLQEQIFPKLDKCCRERGSRFTPVDLRWNKNQSQISNEHVLKVCLDSISLCAPYFICILGERYGVHRAAEGELVDSETEEWLEKNFEVAAASGHEWVLEEENRYNSLTELEIIQSSFRKKYDHGYFYFRDPSHIEDRLKKVDQSNERDNIMDRFKSESDYCSRKIRELKQQIIDTDLAVRHFRTLDELGEQVYRDWLGIIDNLYPPIAASVFRNTDSEEYHDWAAHEMFAETKRKIFIKNLKIREIGEIMTSHVEAGLDMKKKTTLSLPTMKMSTFMTSVPGDEKGIVPPLMVLEGDRGCGKSSLVVNWIQQVSSSYPELPIIPHYVGSSTYSYDVTSLMRHCTKELRLHFLNSDYDDLMENKDISDYRRVMEAFHAALSLGPCVILIDGADDFGSSADVPMFKAKEMQWLPPEIPSSCRLIITTSKADFTFKSLKKRKDAYVVEVPQLFDSATKRFNLLKEYVGTDSKFLDEDFASKILTAKLSELPIFYVAVAYELRHFHGYKNAERQLDAYVQATSLGELWTLILRRWVRDYGWLMPAATRGPASLKAQVSRDRSNSGWVADALRLLAVSRNGLTTEEILGSLKIMGYVRNHEVTTAHWTVFSLVSQNVLVSTSQGLLTFFHQSVRAAVENTLLRSLTSPSQERVISPFKDIWERQKLQCHNVLANYFVTIKPVTTRTVEELPWQHRISGNVSGLGRSLSNPVTFVTLMRSETEYCKKLDMLRYWKTLEVESQNPVELLQQMVTDSQERLEPNGTIRRDVGSASFTTEDLSAVEKICKKTNEDFFTQMEIAVISFFAGKFLAEQNKHAAAERLLLNAYKYGYTVASVRDLDIITRLQEALGNLYFRLSIKENAEYWYRGALKTAAEQTKVNDKVHHEALVGRILNRLAVRLLGNISAPPSPPEGRSKTSPRMGQPNTPSTQRSPSAASGRRFGNENANFKEIGSLLVESLKHLQLAGVVPGKTAVYYQMGLCALGQKQYADAESLLRKALNIREQWYGSSHPLVAEVIETMATVFSLDGLENSDPALAEKMYRKALRMREDVFGSGDLTVADTLVNLGMLLQRKNSKDATREAKQLLQRALDIRTAKLGVYHVQSKLVRRDLMSLETTDAAAKLSSKGPGKELKAIECRGSK